MDAQWTTTNEV